MNKILRYSFMALMAMMFGNVMADTWEKTTSIAVGDVVVLAYESESITKELTGISSTSTKYGIATEYTTTPACTYPLTVEAGSKDGSFAFKTNDNKYLYWNSGNSLNVNGDLSDKTSWTVSFDNGAAIIKNVQDNTRILQFNASSNQHRFACYTTSQKSPIFWKKAAAGGKSVTYITFSDGYQTQIGGGPDGMFPQVGQSVALPTATVKAGDAAVAGATVEWSLKTKSWKPKKEGEVPTIADGKISFDGRGEIEITATYAGNETYKGSTKSYTLRVYNSYGLLSEMVNDIADPNLEKDDEDDKDGSMVFYFFRNIDAGLQSVQNTVTYVNGSYIYLTDGQNNNLLFYGTNSQGLKAGDVISGNVDDANLGGFWGALKRRYKLPQFSFTDMNVKVESSGAAPDPKTITVDQLKDNLNVYVKIENAVFKSASGKTFTFTVGETEFTVYNQWSVADQSKDDKKLVETATYTLTGMGAVYKKDKDTDAVYQLYLASFTKTAEASVNAIKTNGQFQGKMYNTAGQVVNKGYKGLVIQDGRKLVNK